MNNGGMNHSWPGWETVRIIGTGSFGAVYEIQRNVFGHLERAALKVVSIPQKDSDIEEYFVNGYDEESVRQIFKSHMESLVREYTLMRELNGSANVVSCDDFSCIQHEDKIGWDVLIKMELLTPLPKVLEKGFDEQQVICIAKDICKALSLCKKHGIIHRDIKPKNIFVSENGDYKLGDFGIAKTIEKTSKGTRIGTMRYVAPEIYYNQPYSFPVDIYSLGLTLYWLLNERRSPFLPLPPAASNALMEEEAHMRRFHAEALPEPVYGSEELKRIVLKACAYDPNDRYQSGDEMLADLNNLDNSPADVRQSFPVPPAVESKRTDYDPNATTVISDEETARGPGKRKKGLLAIPIAAVICLAVALAVLIPRWKADRPDEVSDPRASAGTEQTGEPSVTVPEERAEHINNGIRWYEIVTDDLSWSDASDAAVQRGGTLVCFETVPEYDYVLQLLDGFKNQNVSFWIGGSELGSDDPKGSTPELAYDPEDSTWQIRDTADGTSAERQGYLIEYGKRPSDEMFYRIDGYDFIIDTRSWSEAAEKADEAGGHLARFETQEELEYVLNQMDSLNLFDVEFFIGAHRDGSEESYYWIDRSETGPGSEKLNDPGSWASVYWLDGEPSFNWDGDFEEAVEIYYSDEAGNWVLNDIRDNSGTSFEGVFFGYIVEYDN